MGLSKAMEKALGKRAVDYLTANGLEVVSSSAVAALMPLAQAQEEISRLKSDAQRHFAHMRAAEDEHVRLAKELGEEKAEGKRFALEYQQLKKSFERLESLLKYRTEERDRLAERLESSFRQM